MKIYYELTEKYELPLANAQSQTESTWQANKSRANSKEFK